MQQDDRTQKQLDEGSQSRSLSTNEPNSQSTTLASAMKSQLKVSSDVSPDATNRPELGKVESDEALSVISREVYRQIEEQPSIEAQIDMVCTYLTQSAEVAQQAFQDKFDDDILALDENLPETKKEFHKGGICEELEKTMAYSNLLLQIASKAPKSL